MNITNGLKGLKISQKRQRDSFKGSFVRKMYRIISRILDFIEPSMSEDVNSKLTALPTEEELKVCVLSMDPDSSPGPDGFTTNFFQKCWLSIILPDLISWNQSGFVKGRAITENILLAQEIIQDIGKTNEKGNVALKLDMAKAYDRVSWSYLCVLMRNLGFSETWIDNIFRHISSNWYSLIVNGTRQAFFKSERGLRQGDPISPSLFVICAEFLSRINHIASLNAFKAFHMNKKGPIINHLAFADDIILFSSGCRKSLGLLMEALTDYERVSGKLVNKQKSCFILNPNAQPEEISRVESIIGMEHKALPIKYLGCPLYVGMKKIVIFSEMITKVINKILGWHTKFLSSGGRAVLIRHVLLALPTHLLAAIHPPKGVLNQIERILNRFFWGGFAERRRYHWSSWDKLRFPYEEGGTNFRKL
ncbi:PREDICTED: uncharacterized protein LOC109235858 [Nicotiana attenuata]|uniref:uncharacterized protein LOC109235858 n=1 Tax=Nicotiana attenuata TaxID=49451 RepID=UPI00090492A4|nr:PREDICTED: uncharacterized protein LOC109235858 [Nicotiana attenuata]